MHCSASSLLVLTNGGVSAAPGCTNKVSKSKSRKSDQKLGPKTRMGLNCQLRSEMMMLTESVIHREELLLVSDQDVCAPPENEIRMVIFAKKIHIYINSCASQNVGSKLVAIANGSASASCPQDVPKITSHYQSSVISHQSSVLRKFMCIGINDQNLKKFK